MVGLEKMAAYIYVFMYLQCQVEPNRLQVGRVQVFLECYSRESVVTVRQLNMGKIDLFIHLFFTVDCRFQNPLGVRSNMLPHDSFGDVPREGWQHRSHAKGPHLL